VPKTSVTFSYDDLGSKLRAKTSWDPAEQGRPRRPLTDQVVGLRVTWWRRVDSNTDLQIMSPDPSIANEENEQLSFHVISPFNSSYWRGTCEPDPGSHVANLAPDHHFLL